MMDPKKLRAIKSNKITLNIKEHTDNKVSSSPRGPEEETASPKTRSVSSFDFPFPMRRGTFHFGGKVDALSMLSEYQRAPPDDKGRPSFKKSLH